MVTRVGNDNIDDEAKDDDLTISCAQPESTMKSMTQGTTASTFERTCEEDDGVVKVLAARYNQPDLSASLYNKTCIPRYQRSMSSFQCSM